MIDGHMLTCLTQTLSCCSNLHRPSARACTCCHVQAVQALLTAAQSSISALPSVGAYIAALGPASAAYAAVSPGMFSSLQDEVGDFASGIQSVRAPALGASLRAAFHARGSDPCMHAALLWRRGDACSDFFKIAYYPMVIVS